MPLLRRLAPLILAALVLAAPPAAAQTKKPITVEDLWKVKRVGKPALSPDGKSVVVDVTTWNMEDNDSTSELWLLATDGKTQRQLTSRGGKVSSPVWSPDGKQVAFVFSGKDRAAQVYVIDPHGGEARKLSKLPMPPSALKWGPTGTKIYCIVKTWLDTPDDDSYRKREKEKKDSKVQAQVIDDTMFRYWDTWVADGKRPVVFEVDAATGAHRNLFAGLKLNLPIQEASASQYDIAPDGKEICFVADSVKDVGSDFNLDLYVMPLDKPGGPRNITTDNEANDNQPAYSPDGKYIAFVRQKIKYFYADTQRLMLHERLTGKNVERFPDFDRSVNNPSWSINWTSASKLPPWLIFDAEDSGSRGIYVEDQKQKLFPAMTRGYTDSAASQHLGERVSYVFLRSSFDRPPGVFAFRAGSGFQQIDHFNDELIAQWKLGKVENVAYKGADDESVQMWIVYPPDFDAKKKWPLLMVVHGGPHNGITTDFHFRWNLQLLAAQGYVVACPNFHGSTGFGQKFTDSITGDMATKPFIDIMKATDHMEKQPYIDKDRLAAAGGSYGGYMMAWINGHTDRFKALICHAGVYNWHSMMASDIVKGRDRALGATAWDDPQKIDKQSPQRFAANFKTPTLILHGEKDFRVPLTQGLEYYNTLKLKGVPTRMVYFPDENHWVLRPQNSRLWHREFFDWLEKYVGHGPK
jgi:dipeptidyl aminopeptidase/acylaminoacyl peptidase